MIPIKIISTNSTDLLQVRFFPTDICNYDCSYCFPGSHEGKFRYPKNIDTVVVNFRKMFDFYTNKYNKTKFQLTISGGGEPTLWPHLEQFCKELKESHDVTIILVSNGSRTLRWWEENSQYFDDVVLSCHHEFVDIDHYNAVADRLFELGVKVTGFCVMDNRAWDKCVNLINTMLTSSQPWFVEAKPIVDIPGIGMDTYTNEQLVYLGDTIKRLPSSDWLLKRLDTLRLYDSIVMFDDSSIQLAQSQSIIVNKWNNFKGWNCRVGFDTIVIGSDGSIKGSCLEEIIDILFNIFQDSFPDNIELKVLSCPRNLCSCSPDTHVTKSLS